MAICGVVTLPRAFAPAALLAARAVRVRRRWRLQAGAQPNDGLIEFSRRRSEIVDHAAFVVGVGI